MKAFNIGGNKGDGNQNADPAATAKAGAAKKEKKSLFSSKKAPAAAPAGNSPGDQVAGTREKPEKKRKAPPPGGPKKKTSLWLGILLIVVLAGAGIYMATNSNNPATTFPGLKSGNIPAPANARQPFGATQTARVPAPAPAAQPVKPPTAAQKAPAAAPQPSAADKLKAAVAQKPAPAPKPTAQPVPKPTPKPLAAQPKPTPKATPKPVAAKPKPAPKPAAKPVTATRAASKPKSKPRSATTPSPVLANSDYITDAPRPVRPPAKTRKSTSTRKRTQVAVASSRGLLPPSTMTWELPSRTRSGGEDPNYEYAQPAGGSRGLHPLPDSAGVPGNWRSNMTRLYEWRPVSRAAILPNESVAGGPPAPAPGRVTPAQNGFAAPVTLFVIFVKESANRAELVRIAERMHVGANPEITQRTDGYTTMYTLTVGHYTSELKAANVADSLRMQNIQAKVITEKVYQ